MNPTQNICVMFKEGQEDSRESPASEAVAIRPLSAPVRRAIARTRHWLLLEQQPDGCWCAELEGDTILESETILLLAYLGRADTELARHLAAYLVEQQLPEGGWAM